MMITPPPTTSRDERRSSRMRRLVRARLMASGPAGGPGPPVFNASAPMAMLLDLVDLFLGHRGGDREIAVLDHHFLTLLREHQLDELSGRRIERLARKSTRLNSSHSQISYS